MKIVLKLLLLNLATINAVKKAKYCHPIDDNEYEILYKLACGSFQKSVKERTTKEKSTMDEARILSENLAAVCLSGMTKVTQFRVQIR